MKQGVAKCVSVGRSFAAALVVEGTIHCCSCDTAWHGREEGGLFRVGLEVVEEHHQETKSEFGPILRRGMKKGELPFVWQCM